MHFVTATTVAVAALASSVLAHGPPGSHSGFKRQAAAASTTAATEQSQAKIEDPTQECTYKYIPEVNELLYNYPKIWATADIVANDTEGMALWKKIEPSVPTDIQPRGTRDGDFNNVQYDAASDPACWWTIGEAGKKCMTPKHPNIPDDVYICDEPKTWGYTFDDGPNCTHNAFYDFLQEKKQKATMFYIGSNVLNWPLQAQRGIVDGHHLMSHTWSHPYMTALTNTQVFAELYYASKAIRDVTGVTVTGWRPPYGDVDDRVRAIATGLGLKTVIWSADTDDWEQMPAGKLTKQQVTDNYNNIINAVSDTTGNIVLTHEINGDTMQMAMDMYPMIAAKFDHIVPLTACMNWTSPYAEGNITYPNFSQYAKGNIEPKGAPSPSQLSIYDAPFNPIGGGGASAVAAAGTSSGTTSAQQANSKSSSGTSDAMGIKPMSGLAAVGAALAGAGVVLAAL
ncbi:unnamed protein product [Sympodiomycopsis kandeliae]